MVDTSVYVVHGWKLPFQLVSRASGEELDRYREDLLPYVEGWEDAKYTLIADQMCGEYLIFGIRLAHECVPGNFRVCPVLPVTKEDSIALKAEFDRIFGEYVPVIGECVPPAEPSTFMFVHYS